jgi:hypothetical protein
MRCEDVAPHLVDHLAGTLADRTRDAVQEHLAACAACRDEAAALSDTWQLLDEIPAAVPDSAAMRARFDALLEGYEQGRARVVRIPLRRRLAAWMLQPRQMQPLLQACAAMLILVAGVVAGRQMMPAASPAAASAPAQDVSAMRQELRDLREMVTLSLIQQQSASERLKGVSWTGQLDRPGNEVVAALLDTLMHDPNVNVRLASIDALKRFANRDTVRRTALDALDTQTSPLVQMALIDFMVEMQQHDALDVLRRISRNDMVNQAVRSRAAWGVDRLEARS